jgi:hypothetical protein
MEFAAAAVMIGLASYMLVRRKKIFSGRPAINKKINYLKK